MAPTKKNTYVHCNRKFSLIHPNFLSAMLPETYTFFWGGRGGAGSVLSLCFPAYCLSLALDSFASFFFLFSVSLAVFLFYLIYFLTDLFENPIFASLFYQPHPVQLFKIRHTKPIYPCKYFWF